MDIMKGEKWIYWKLKNGYKGSQKMDIKEVENGYNGRRKADITKEEKWI